MIFLEIKLTKEKQDFQSTRLKVLIQEKALANKSAILKELCVKGKGGKNCSSATNIAANAKLLKRKSPKHKKKRKKKIIQLESNDSFENENNETPKKEDIKHISINSNKYLTNETQNEQENKKLDFIINTPIVHITRNYDINLYQLVKSDSKKKKKRRKESLSGW